MKNKEFATWLPHVEPLDVDFGQEDIEDALIGHVGAARLFGIISRSRILEDLAKHGLQVRLEARGYRGFEAEIQKLSPYEESCKITASHEKLVGLATLIDLRAHWGRLKLPVGEVQCRALIWDWVELTDPLADFASNHPRLPGQTSPGLSLFRPLVELMLGYVASTEADALVAVPQYFHNAVLYFKDPGLRFRFLEPLRHGQLIAQIRDLQKEGLAVASWAFEEHRVESLAPGSPNWTPHGWSPAELVLGLRQDVKDYLSQQDPLIAEGQSYQFRIRPPV